MSDPSTIETTIETLASKPASVQNDTTQVVNQSPFNLVVADKWLEAKRAARRTTFGFVVMKTTCPGGGG